MINPEKLLGQLVGGMLGKQGKKRKKGGNDLFGSLTSGAGLMTAIGLAVGAYEVLKDKTAGGMATPGAPPPFPQSGQPASPPPPPIPPVQQAEIMPPVVSAEVPGVAAGAVELSEADLARRMIQIMAAAANADGMMDEREEQAILDRLREIEISQEERLYLLDELHHPKEVAELVAGVSSPATAKAMYMLAFAAIEVDTDAERQWLDQLARGLKLSPAVQKFIEEQNG